ncbi:MAG: prolipoprotein diacylglyceryl transferase [Pseudomonadota bacterium]
MNLTFPNIDPVALSIGPFDIRWYALAYLAGFLLGWRYCLALSKRDDSNRPSVTDIEDFLPWAIIGVILGGRLGYILFYNFDVYLEHPLEALKIWQGGMSFHGGMMGVVASLIIYPLKRGFNMFRLGDLVAAATPIGLFFGRIANFINGELFGRVTDSPLGIVFPYGGPEPRHASQLYEAVLEGVLLFIILGLLIRNDSVRNKPGIVAGTFLVGYAIFRFGVEFFREPDAHIGFVFGTLSMGQILCIPMFIAGLIMIALAALGKTKINE